MPIVRLDKATINKIAAGEVVENPASVVKELIENSLDAGADFITVEIEGGGDKLIRVIDNGTGIPEKEIELAFERYATSKISSLNDIYDIRSLGFRGEALPSIASVSNVEVITNTQKGKGIFVRFKNGEMAEKTKMDAKIGTMVTVKDLFHNVPARKKFLRSERAEFHEINFILNNFLLLYPHVNFRVIHNGKENMHLKGDLKHRYISMFKDIGLDDLWDIGHSDENISISGFVSSPRSVKKTKKNIFIGINGRLLKENVLTYYFSAAYEGFLMKGQYPHGVINITIDPQFIDVNVHPRKTEIKLLNPSAVRNAILNGIRKKIRDSIDQRVFNAERATIGSQDQVKDNAMQTSLDLGVGISNISLSENTVEYLPKRVKIGKEEYELTGFIFENYALMQGKNDFLLIDVHAADERVLFEKIKRATGAAMIMTKELLFPIKIEQPLTDDALKWLRNNGFSVNIDGNCIETIPEWIDMRRTKEEVEEIIAGLLDEKEVFDDWIRTLACRSAVRSGDRIPDKLIIQILNDLLKTGNPYQCPHGRPVIVKFTKTEIEKLFKRK